MNIYCSINPGATRHLDIDALIEAYSWYTTEKAAIPGFESFRPISINEAYTLAAALRNNETEHSAAMFECPECSVLFYYSINQTVVADCPFCNWRVKDTSEHQHSKHCQHNHDQAHAHA